MDEELRTKLEQAHRILHMEGLAEDASRGHVTARTGDGRIYIKPWGVDFEEVEAGDFQAVDKDGNLVEGQGRIHSEIPIHLEIYRRRRDVSSIAHVHPYYAVLLSSVFKGKIHVLSHHATLFSGKIPFYTPTELVQSKQQGAKLALALGDRPVVLMKNHGITVAGKSVEETTILSIHFEQAAKDHLLATIFGKPSGIPLTVAKKMSAHSYSPSQCRMLWGHYWRKFSRKAG
jgi:L-fuculose-phosphate aldolase